MTNRDDRDTFDLDETAELPKITHETTDIPRFGFPKDPDDIKQHDVPYTGNHETTGIPSFKDEIKEMENTQNLPVIEKSAPQQNKNSQKKKGTFKINPKRLNIAMTLVTVIVNALVTFMMFQITRYAAIGKEMFLYLNIGVLVVLLLIDFLLVIVIRTRKIAVFVIDLLVLCMFLGVGGYGSYVLAEVNKSIDKVTNTEDTEKEVSASLVIYSGTSGDPIVNLEDLEGRRVGLSTGSNTGKVAKKKLENDGVNVEWIECAGYDEVINSLLDGTVDCAVLSTNWKSQLEGDEALSVYLDDLLELTAFSDTVQSSGVAGAEKDITKEPFTVLLTGENEGLADTIILMSVNPISMKVIMTSIPRDSYVSISCYNGGKSKINSAHATSEACMVETVQNLTGVAIDYTIEFNYASVIKVVDAVGGVTVDVETTFMCKTWDLENDTHYEYYIGEGKDVHMNGMDALGFARERYAFPDGDFARQRHQQEIIQQVVSKLMASKSPQMFLDVLEAAGDNIKTNFTVEQMTSFVNYALQKAQRYYNQGDISGIFQFVSSREFGYSRMVWNEGLQMSLYTYELFNGSIRDNTNAIERNCNLNAAYSTPDPVNWSAGSTYIPDPISYEWYDEQLLPNVEAPVQETVVEAPPVAEQPAVEDPVVEEPPVVEDTPVEEPPVDVPQEPAGENGTGEQTE